MFLPPFIKFSMSYNVSEKSNLKLPLLNILSTYNSTFFVFFGCSLILSEFINVFLKAYFLVNLTSISLGKEVTYGSTSFFFS